MLDKIVSNNVKKTKVQAIVNTYKGKTYLFVNKFMVWSMNECTFRPQETHVISDLFPGVPAEIDNVFRYTNGRLYFIQKDMFFEYDEFTDSLIRSGTLNLAFFDINCPNVSLLQSLKNLLNKIVSNNVKIKD